VADRAAGATGSTGTTGASQSESGAARDSVRSGPPAAVGQAPGDSVAEPDLIPFDHEPAAPRSAVETPRRPAGAAAPEPSWGKVLATTISLWASRRLRRLTGGGRAGGPGGTATAGARPRRSGIRWPLVAFIVVLVVVALTVLELSRPVSQPGNSHGASGSSSGSGSGSNRALATAQAVRSATAAWVTDQISASDVIACDPLMCSALESDGVAASRLMTVQATTPDPLGADVVVATSSVRSQFGQSLVSEYAPQLVASFGSGASRIDVRAVAPDGAAAFNAAERLDLSQRQAAGAQLIRNDKLIGEKDAAAIRAGQVDSRLLVTLAFLLSQRPVDVGSFQDTAPGAPILYREVTVVDAPGQVGSAALKADLSQVRTQATAFRPAHASIVQLANGQTALRIQFGAPDPPGLLAGGGNS
jgi:hypothetical protein